MSVPSETFAAIREAIATFPADVSNDAHGVQVPRLEDVYAPQVHSAALDPSTAVVSGARGTGKSFWAAVLYDETLRSAATAAYPRLGLERLRVAFGFSGLSGPAGVSRDHVDALVPRTAGDGAARHFWWATVLQAIERAESGRGRPLRELIATANDVDERDALLTATEATLAGRGQTLLVVYDALDAVASTWPRRRLMLQALFEVVWSLRAWPSIRPKVFVRPDQLEDDELRFVELPKLRTGAARLTWSGVDLYGLLLARLAVGDACEPFAQVLRSLQLPHADQTTILARRWTLTTDAAQQKQVMQTLSGPYMGSNHRKGNTYDWPLNHLGDAFAEVTPRSFLGLAIGAARHGQAPRDRVFTPEGIRHGLRAASKTRVDQLHHEFPWIKGVLAPLAGLLLPRNEEEVFGVWRGAQTVHAAVEDAAQHGYLSPFADAEAATEAGLFRALERIGVMFQRGDGRLDMPDIFRVAARLLKKNGIAPL